MLTQKRLKELLHYDPDTGIFTRKLKRRKHLKGEIAGCSDAKRYILIKIDGIQYKAHRLAWFYVYGEMPRRQIDHKDHNICNNRINNLRNVTNAQNQQNLSGPQKGNKSGFLGVRLHECGKYDSRIMVNGKRIHLGFFVTAEEAYRKYLKAKRELHPYSTL